MDVAQLLTAIGVAVGVVVAFLKGVRDVLPHLHAIRDELAANTKETKEAKEQATNAANHSAERAALESKVAGLVKLIIDKDTEIYRLRRWQDAVRLEPGAQTAIAAAERRLEDLRMQPAPAHEEPAR